MKSILYILMIGLWLLPMAAAAQDQTPPPPKTGKFDAQASDAKGRFEDHLKSAQDRFEAQLNNPKPSNEKPKKQKKEKAERKPSREVVAAPSEVAQRQAKSGGFKQSAMTKSSDGIVRGVRTSAAVPIANITPEKARSEAIRLAKEEALRLVVGEEVSASTTIIDHGQNESTMASISTIGSRGGIVGLELTRDTPVVDPSGASSYEVEIIADVKVYDKSSVPTISFDVAGIKHGYSHRETMRFSVTPSDSCFVYIFLFDSMGGGTLLVPSKYEPVNQLSKNSATAFPSNRAIQYTLILDNPMSNEEINTLLVVTFTRAVPITPEVCRNVERTLCWIYGFDPTQRSSNIEVLPIRIYAAK